MNSSVSIVIIADSTTVSFLRCDRFWSKYFCNSSCFTGVGAILGIFFIVIKGISINDEICKDVPPAYFHHCNDPSYKFCVCLHSECDTRNFPETNTVAKVNDKLNSEIWCVSNTLSSIKYMSVSDQTLKQVLLCIVFFLLQSQTKYLEQKD